MINIAFAGLRHGHIFSLYNEAIGNPEYTVLGAFEENEDARRVAEAKGLMCNYESLDALLADERVDVVALGGCYGMRGGVAIKALRAGKHVIADKPLTTSLEELEIIEREARLNNKKVSCMFTMRYEARINGAKRLFESGALGEIAAISFGGQHPLQYGRRPDWYFEENMHGGVINDIAIHGIDTLSYAFGIKADRINAARCWNKLAQSEPHFLDCAQFMLTAQNGAGILADVSYAIPDGVEFHLPYYWQFYVWGTKGVLSFSHRTLGVYYLAGDPDPHELEEAMVSTYLDDFLKMLNGEEDVILPMDDVLSSTRKTLEIQGYADQNNTLYKRRISCLS